MRATPSFSAETLVPLRAPSIVMSHLREHFEEHGAIAGADNSWTVAFDIGKASAHLRDGAVAFRVEANDDSSLAFLQWSVAEHVCEFAPDEQPQIVWHGGTLPGAKLPYFREMTVLRTQSVTPAMQRVTLSGENLGRFAHDGMHVRLLFPPAPGVRPVWPVMAADGRQAWPEGERPVARVYTIRRIDVETGEIDIDFVLHPGEGMPGARFGREAVPGAVIGMTGPGGFNLKPAGRYIFAGDETALPAIARMLEELPTGVKAKAFLEIADAGEIQDLPVRAGVEVKWLSRDGAAAGSTTLLADALGALEASDWDGDPYVWVACEHSASRAIRSFLRKDRHIPRERHLVAAYWRNGQSGEIAES